MTHQKLQEVVSIPVDQLYLDAEFNCREFINPIECDSLARDIKENGLSQPIVVQPYTKKEPFKYRLIMGHRRLTAVRDLLKDSHIPAIIRTDEISTAQALTLNVQENLQRKQLNLKEESVIVGRFALLGYSRSQIAKKLNMGKTWVQLRTMMAMLPTQVQDEIVRNNISQIEIRQIYSLFDDAVDGNFDKMFIYVKALKEGKDANAAIKTKKPKRKTEKRTRSKAEMMEILDHVRDSGRGSCIVTRVLAWCAGNIDNGDLDLDLKNWHDEEGFDYASLFDDGSDAYS